MSEVFVVKNQLGHYWGKIKAWEDGTEPKAIMRFKHEDEAMNTLFELSSKDIALRGEIATVGLSDKGNPVVEPSEHLLPKPPKVAKGAARVEDTEESSETVTALADETAQQPDGTVTDTNSEDTTTLET